MNLTACRCTSAFFTILAADALVSLSVFIPPASAQASGANNSGVQLQEHLRDSVKPPRDFESSEQPLLAKDKTSSEIDSVESNEETTVFFKAVRFEGNSEIGTEALVQPFLPFIGQEVTFKQLKNAALESESIYKRDGFITTRVLILPQDFNSGNVVIRVVEGFLEDLEIRGANSGLQAYVRKILQPAVNDKKSEIFNYKTLERQLLQIRNFGGVKFNITLVKGSKIGASRLVVDLTPNSFAGGLGVNNRVSEQLGDWQTSGTLEYVTPTAQPFKLYTSGSYAFPYENGLVTGLGMVSTPIGNAGFKANFLWSSSSTASKNLYSGPTKIQTKGSSNYWSFGISYPLILKRNSELSVALRGTGQNSTNDLYLDSDKAFNVSTDKIRAIRLAVDGYYASSRATNTMAFTLSQGISGLDNELDADEFLSNPYSDSNFTSARLDFSRTQNIFDFGTLLTVKGTGQLSSSAVPVPEAFTYGGSLYGRGFSGVYILGDQGWAASVELAQKINFHLFNDSSSVTPFIWYDHGDTQYSKGSLQDQSASTYGLGMRTNAYNLDLELGWGIPSSSTLDSGNAGTDNSILYFNAGWRF